MDRRDFVKLLGFGSAVVPTEVKGEIVPQTLSVSDPASLDRIWWDIAEEWLYAGVQIPKNSMQSEYTLFQEVLGMPRLDGTYTDTTWTNMVRAGELPPPTVYGIQKIGVCFDPRTEPALRSTFVGRYVLTVWIGQKRYFRAPLSAMFSVGEPSLEVNPVFPVKGAIGLELPIVIPSMMSFHVTLEGQPIQPHGRLKLWAYFVGRHARAVQ